MLHAILAQDADDGLERRLSERPKHLERLMDLQNAGKPFKHVLP